MKNNSADLPSSENEALRILIATENVTAGGEGVHIRTLARTLTAMGNTVYVCAGSNSQELGTGPDGDIKFVRIAPGHHLSGILRNASEIRRLVKENRIDIVHCHGRGSAFAVHLAHLKVPYVYTCHTMSLQTDFFHRAITKYGCEAIAVSSACREFMEKGLGIPENKITVIPNGIDQSAFTPLSGTEKQALRKKYRLPEGCFTAAVHGRFDVRKNHRLIAEAVKALPEEDRKKLVVLCSGWRSGPCYEEFVQTLRKYGISGNFRFTGWTSSRSILGVSDVLLAPSLVESFLMTAVEAFFMKVPVIRSVTGGYEEMKDICIGLPASDIHAWTAALHGCIVGGTGDGNMCGRAYEKACREFTAEVMAARTLKVYKKAIAENVRRKV